MKAAVVGLQWGDEGKGKIIDILAPQFDLVVRYQGGPNAGHTVRRGDRKIIFHQVPSGVMHPEVDNLIAAGCVINPSALLDEIKTLADLGIDCQNRLYISKFAHIILPYHIQFDKMREKGKGKPLGTTKRGVGMCYEDKFARIGIRIADLIDEEHLAEKIKYLISHKNFLLIEIYGSEPIDERTVLKNYLDFGKRLAPMVVIDSYFTKGYNSKNILFESAQGTLLDIDFGTYPFVTSSHPIIGGIGASLGFLSADLVKIGIVKSYTTRVGMGPFPTELDDPLGEEIREKGKEYGATTGRPRRCGWLDAPAIRYAALVNGLNSIIITKLDVLTGINQIKIGVGYKTANGNLDQYDPTQDNLRPSYKVIQGWSKGLTGIGEYNGLPHETKSYISEIEELTGLEVIGISVGPEPEQMIWRRRIG